MKALLASTLTALVLVSAAWASNVTPAQLSALSKRVTKLEHTNAALKALTIATADQIVATQSALAKQDDVVTCLQEGWNAQNYQSYTTYTAGGFGTNTGNLTMLVAPAATDGIVGDGYLIFSKTQMAQC